MTRAPRVGERCEHLELERVWAVDPSAGQSGVADLFVAEGRVVELRWSRRAAPQRPATVVLPGFVDLHTHLREPGRDAAETVATGLEAAAHGGFTTICAMGNTDPPSDTAGTVREVLALGANAAVPVRLLAYGTISEDRAGMRLAPLGALADAGAIGFSDDGAPIDDSALFRHALEYAGGLGLPIVEHAELRALTAGGEAHEGLPATILGLQGWPVAGEAAAVARALAILDDVVRHAPAGSLPRLHLTHLSTADALMRVRLAKDAGLPVTCDVAPHHLALHDGWVAGDRRFAWEAAARPWAGEPTDAAPYDPATRVNPPLTSPADALALWAGVADGTVDAIATDHAPHREVDKNVEFGDAAPGISGLETALSLALAGVAAGLADLTAVTRALTLGPAGVLHLAEPGLTVGKPADLVVLEPEGSWVVDAEALRSKGKNTPLLGRTLPGRVLLTVAGGRFAYLDPDLAT